MQKFEELASGTAIRHILSIHDENTDEYHAVFMIVDVLEPDMQDYPSDINHTLIPQHFDLTLFISS